MPVERRKKRAPKQEKGEDGEGEGEVGEREGGEGEEETSANRGLFETISWGFDHPGLCLSKIC